MKPTFLPKMNRTVTDKFPGRKVLCDIMQRVHRPIKCCFTVTFLLSLTVLHASLYAREPSPVIKPCMPPPAFHDERLMERISSMLVKNAPLFQGKTIIRIVPRDKWRIQRNEFTAIIMYRTLPVEVAVRNDGSPTCTVFPCIIKQKASFPGFTYGELSLRMVLKNQIYTIVQENIFTSCKGSLRP